MLRRLFLAMRRKSMARTMRGSDLLCERGEIHEGSAMRREGTAGISMVHMVIKATKGL